MKIINGPFTLRGLTVVRKEHTDLVPTDRPFHPPSPATAPISPMDLASDLEDATHTLVTFDSHAASTLGPESPALGPMSAVLLRTESSTSSQIENLTAGARQLALAELNESKSLNAKMIIANVRALEAALSLADQLDESSHPQNAP